MTLSGLLKQISSSAAQNTREQENIDAMTKTVQTLANHSGTTSDRMLKSFVE